MLCEQAAEKIIRAIVTSEGKHAGFKHELAEMVDLIPDETFEAASGAHSETVARTTHVNVG
ncbi:MAG: hypothetical protein SFX73_04020 [Kofleriaceae bacterium]|nr:hypothetical protein [Kofleriaceae bacterium]